MKKQSDKFIKPITLKTATGFHYFDYDEIVMFKADGHDVNCITVEGDSALKVYHTLAYLEEKYCNKSFCRCNKSTIVNLRYISCLEIRTRKIFLKDNSELKISEDFLKSLRNISKDNSGQDNKNSDL